MKYNWDTFFCFTFGGGEEGNKKWFRKKSPARIIANVIADHKFTEFGSISIRR